jgi:hypothetical protein
MRQPDVETEDEESPTQKALKQTSGPSKQTDARRQARPNDGLETDIETDVETDTPTKPVRSKSEYPLSS